MRTLGSARLTIAASVPFAINQWSKKTARRSDTVDDGKQLPFLLHDQRKDAVINTPLTANWMVLKCLKLKNHVLETWMLENMSDIESNLSIAMHLHVHNGEIMDETRLLHWQAHMLDEWRLMVSNFAMLARMTYRRHQWLESNSFQLHCSSMPLTNVGIVLPDQHDEGCTTVLMMLQRCSHWLRCVLGSQMQLCAYYRCEHTCAQFQLGDHACTCTMIDVTHFKLVSDIRWHYVTYSCKSWLLIEGYVMLVRCFGWAISDAGTSATCDTSGRQERW